MSESCGMSVRVKLTVMNVRQAARRASRAAHSTARLVRRLPDGIPGMEHSTRVAKTSEANGPLPAPHRRSQPLVAGDWWLGELRFQTDQTKQFSPITTSGCA